MKRTLIILGVLLLSGIHMNSLWAQPVRTVVIKATTPEQDTKPNSDTVPDVYAMAGQFDTILVLRFKFKADLLEGIQQVVKDRGIRNGVILSGIGSVRSFHIHNVSNREFPSENVYIRDPNAPADIAGMNGYIIDGRVHTHITLSDEHRAFGGHLEPGTNVFTFAIVTIGVFNEDIDLSGIDDKSYR